MKKLRFTAFLSAAILLLFCLPGCASLGLQTATLQDTIALPADGIIAESVFAQLKEQNGVVTIAGTSGDLRYEWTVFGSDIETPKDCNMAVELRETDANSLSLRFAAEDEFDFSPVLSIYLNEQWDTQSALVCRITNGSQETVCSASVTGSKTSVLNFSVPSSVGNFEVLPELPTTQSDTAASTPAAGSSGAVAGTDPYLSETAHENGRVYSDGTATEQDQYKTDPVPEGKPLPVEPENQAVDQKKACTCSFSIECSTILNNLENLNEDKLDEVPSSGVIFPTTTVTFYEGESVYDVLQRICEENNIHMEASWTPIYNSAYVEGIHNLYEFDCGTGSGWMYRVDGWYPNYGCSRYQLKQGETVEWRYTCDLGSDIGGGYAMGG